MSGSAELFIQPSEIVSAVALAKGSRLRAIPTPGISTNTPPSPGVAGIASCANLLASSPPTLLEAYEVFSYTIGFGVSVGNSGGLAAAPNVVLELVFLVNDRVRYRTMQSFLSVESSANNAGASGAWVADLVNPFTLGARDRLSLQIGLIADQALTSESIVVGAQVDPTSGQSIPYESTISYNVLDMPASRRL